MSINLSSSTYSLLNKYAVLGGTKVWTEDNQNVVVTVNNGNVGSETPLYSGNITGTFDSINADAAGIQLDTLYNNIQVVRANLATSITLGDLTTSYTFLPNINYYNGSNISFSTGCLTLTFDAQGNSNAQFFIYANAQLVFSSSPVIRLLNGASACNIFWIAGGGIFSNPSPPNLCGIFIANNNIGISGNISGCIYVRGSAVIFNSNTTVNAPSCINNSISSRSAFSANNTEVVCYAKGTLILTRWGYIPIENIRTGNKIVTKGKIYENKVLEHGARLRVEPVSWISKFKVDKLDTNSLPICIERNSLGKKYPFKDLYVSPGHNLLINGKMVSAKDLVNGNTIYQVNEMDGLEYYHLECEDHSAIIANGILSETYLDLNNRKIFVNRIKPRRKISSLKRMYI